jgi:hypothetical protein
MSRIITQFWVYVFPLPTSVGMYFVWAAWSGSRTFALYVMLLPLVYGYVAPGIATNLLRKWRFKGPWLVGNFYAHHGFMYSANMAPLLFVAFLGTPHEPISAATAVRILICTAALHGFVLWLHDILIVRHDMVEIYNRPASQGRSPEEIVTHYAPLCFFLIGLTYAAGSLLTFQTIVINGEVDAKALCWLSFIGIGLMLAIPSIAYRIIERPQKDG